MPPEMPLALVQHDFHAALWHDAVPDGLTADVPAEIEKRFAIYRNNVHHSLRSALGARFPVIEQLVGKTFFKALARAYIATSPPRNPVLLFWGSTFAEFLEGFGPLAHLPWLGDVARLEFARGRACHAADAAPAALEALASADPAQLRFVLHPSVELFTSPYPSVQIWAAHQAGKTPKGPFGKGPDHALIARQPDFTVIVETLDAETYAVLGALLGAQTLGDAATVSDPTRALTLLIRHGLITAIETGDPT